MTENDTLETIRTNLYLKLLQSLALEDPSLQNVVLDIALGSTLNEFDNSECNMLHDNSGVLNRNDSMPERGDILTKEEILRHGTPARHLLNNSTRQRLLTEVQKTLQSITDFFYADITEEPPIGDGMKRRLQMLPETIQLQKDQIKFLKQEVKTLCYRLTNLVDEIASKSEDLNQDLIQATTTVFPAYDAARTASIDLLAAAIEASLIKLSLTKARSERALYNHNPGQKWNKEGRNVAQAITTAFGVLKKDEKDAKIEISSLDRQLEGYETLLNLVDGGNGGYQQIINDWTKVKQETDECLKDLRRLGWTGD